MSAPGLNPQSEAVLHLSGDLARQHADAASAAEQAKPNDRAQEFLREVERLRALAPPTQYTVDDVPRLVAEFREEKRRASRS